MRPPVKTGEVEEKIIEAMKLKFCKNSPPVAG